MWYLWDSFRGFIELVEPPWLRALMGYLNVVPSASQLVLSTKLSDWHAGIIATHGLVHLFAPHISHKIYDAIASLMEDNSEFQSNIQKKTTLPLLHKGYGRDRCRLSTCLEDLGVGVTVVITIFILHTMQRILYKLLLLLLHWLTHLGDSGMLLVYTPLHKSNAQVEYKQQILWRGNSFMVYIAWHLEIEIRSITHWKQTSWG